MESSVRMRSSSVGSRPKPKVHRVSRAESPTPAPLDVRCGCQFYQTTSLLPERVNPAEHEDMSYACQQHSPPSNRYSGSDFSQTSLQSTFSPVTLSSRNRMIHPSSEQPMFMNSDHLHPNAPRVDFQFTDCSDIRERHASASALPRTPSTIRQRDPSHSSLVRRRMSEDRQMGTIKRTTSQWSNASCGGEARVITQRDPTQSTILRRKINNQHSLSSASFHGRSAKQQDDMWCVRTQPLCIPSSGTITQRTVSHLNINPREIRSPRSPARREQLSPAPVASTPFNPLGQNRRDSVYYAMMDEEIDGLEATRRLNQLPSGMEVVETIEKPPIPDAKPYRKEEWEIEVNEEHKLGVISIARSTVEKPPVAEPKAERQPVASALPDRRPQSPQRFEIHKTPLEMPSDRRSEAKMAEPKTNGSKVTFSKDEQTEPLNYERQRQMSLSPKPRRKLSEMMVCQEVVQTKSVPTKIQVQHIAKLMEAETLEYTHSKQFDNYESSNEINRIPHHEAKPGTPTFVQQRDPSQSRFTRDRYRTPTPSVSINFPEFGINRSETNLPPMPMTDARPFHHDGNAFIQQKDLRTSKLLQRRRRNLSQTSLQDDRSSQLAAATSLTLPAKLSKTVSFEFDNQMQTEPYANQDERKFSHNLNESEMSYSNERRAVQR